MKFLCESCKAKYQIADEKVAGRTVRMKCRKCGHMIEVEASVTETSVAVQNPAEPGVRPSVSTGLTGNKGAVGAAAMGLSPAPGRPPVPAPRPAASGARASTPPPAAPATGRHGVPAAQPPARPAPKTDAPAASPNPTSAGLAGAFSKAVSAPKEDPSSVSAAMSVLSSSSTTEEWYVGINGVPVGPVRLSELRRKAASGLVTEESLVWREGFEEWVPLRTYPELCAMLKEATTGRTSFLPPAPPGGQSSRPAAGTGRHTSAAAPAATGRTSAPPRAPGAGSAAGRSNVVALSSRRATAEKIDGLEEPIEDTIKFESPPPPAPAAATESVLTKAADATVAAAPMAPAAPQPSAPAQPSVIISEPPVRARDSIAALGAKLGESRRAHPALWAVVALGCAFVGLVGGLLLQPKPPKPTVQIVSVMVPVPQAPAPADSDGANSVGEIEVAPGAVAAKPGGTGKAKDAPVTAGGGPAAPLSPSLHGLGGLVTGPTAPNVGGPSAGGGGQLAAADVERVVQSHRAFVKRQCWESALAGKAPGSPSSVRVAVQINVAPSGSVSSANATGGDGYPGLASCVQGQVTKWKFPPSDGSAVTVPFVFAAQ